MLLLITNLAMADINCSENVSVQQLDAQLSNLAVSFAERDVKLLASNWGVIEQTLPCVNEQIPQKTAGQFHLLTGLYYSVVGEETKGAQAFSVAKSIDPDIEIPQYLLPEGHFILNGFAKVVPAERKSPNIELSTGEVLAFDGGLSDRPKDAPTIVQWIVDEKVLSTQYIGPFAKITRPQADEKTAIAQSGSGNNASSQTSSNELKQYIQQKRRRNRRIALGATAGLSGLISYSTAQNFMEYPSESNYRSNQIFFGVFVFSSSALVVDIGRRYWKKKKANK